MSLSKSRMPAAGGLDCNMIRSAIEYMGHTSNRVFPAVIGFQEDDGVRRGGSNLASRNRAATD